MSRRSREEPEAGFVLVAVLIVLVVVASAAAGVAQLVQRRTAATAGRARIVAFQGMADGAVRLAAYGLLTERVRRLPGFGLPVDGTPVGCSLGGGARLDIAVQDQAGLIDLNGAAPLLLEDAFRALGVPDGDARAIAAEILARRETGAPAAASAAAPARPGSAGIQTQPAALRRAAFSSVAEIDGLRSLSDANAAILRPALTVYNSDGRLDAEAAPFRAALATTRGEALRPFLGPAAGRAFAVTAILSDGTGARAGRSAILSLDGRLAGTGLVRWSAATALSGSPVPHAACAAFRAALEDGTGSS